MKEKRVDKTNYYLDIAETVSERSTCIRRKYGAIIVKDDSIVSTGYNGSPRGSTNCTDIGSCVRQELNIPSGERYELCRSVHAEANAIINASRERMIGSTLYLVCRQGDMLGKAECCMMCKRMIVNSGITKIVIRVTANQFEILNVEDIVRGGIRYE